MAKIDSPRDQYLAPTALRPALIALNGQFVCLPHWLDGCIKICYASLRADSANRSLSGTTRLGFQPSMARSGCEETIRLAKLPKQPIDKAIAAPGLLAAVIDSKFNRHMPLYRQEAMFAEANISVTRGTLSNWLIKSAQILTPLVKLMEADIYDYDIAYADETSLQVLKEKDRAPTQKSFMWLFIRGPSDKRAFVYQYHPTRSHQISLDFFADFQSYLHADCYKAYVVLGQQELIHHVACWAHARRYFMDITKSNKKEGLAHQVVKLIGKLYLIERELKDKNATPVLIFMKRAKEARPILLQIKALLDDAQLKVPPKAL